MMMFLTLRRSWMNETRCRVLFELQEDPAGVTLPLSPLRFCLLTCQIPLELAMITTQRQWTI